MNRAQIIEKQLRGASPLTVAKTLKELELYDKKESQEVFDEVYKQFQNGDNQVNTVLKPVMLGVLDSLMEAAKPLKEMRKKGVTASRIWQECENFSYDKKTVVNSDPDAYQEAKNMREETGFDANVTTLHTVYGGNGKAARNARLAENQDLLGDAKKNSQMYDYENHRAGYYQDKGSMDAYKDDYFRESNIKPDEYTGENLKKDSKANTDHIIPLARVYDQYSRNIALNSEDIRVITNINDNYAMTSETINKSKDDQLNEEIEKVKRNSLDDKVRTTMVEKSKEAQIAVDKAANKAVIQTLIGEGNVDVNFGVAEHKNIPKLEQEYSEQLLQERQNIAVEQAKENAAKEGKTLTEEDVKKIKENTKLSNDDKKSIVNKVYKEAKAQHSQKMGIEVSKRLEKLTKNKNLTKQEKEKLKKQIVKEVKEENKRALQKQKQIEVRNKLAMSAFSQSTDYLLGNLIIFIIKPIVYEMKDIIKKGLKAGVAAKDKFEAIKKRFGRVKNYILNNGVCEALGIAKDFVKMLVSSLIEGIINLFVGFYKMIFKIIKEGIKIFVKAYKIIWGEDGKQMTDRQKGDAILKLIGAAVGGLIGIGVEQLLGNLAIIPGWARVVLATFVSGLVSALFMNALDKMDLFSVKSEQRRLALEKIYNQRIKEVEEATNAMDSTAIDVLNQQQQAFNNIANSIKDGISSGNYVSVSENISNMASFLKIELPYGSKEEFVRAYDTKLSLSLD